MNKQVGLWKSECTYVKGIIKQQNQNQNTLPNRKFSLEYITKTEEKVYEIPHT